MTRRSRQMRAGLTLAALVCLLQAAAVTCSDHSAESAAHAEGHREDKSLPDHPAHHENSVQGQEFGHYGSDHGHGHGDTPEYHVFHVEFERVEIPFIIALWIFVSSLAKIGFHMTPKLHHIFPESCLLIVVGIIIGFLLFLTSEHPPSTLTPNVFFLFMLPPIILDAGYFMPNRLFFDHLGTILLMAVVGTIFNVITIGLALWGCGQAGIYGEHDTPGLLETFLFSSLISAVDPVAVLAVFEEIQVDEVLYIVVFGESLLNDAVTVVLYNMFESYVEIEEENITVAHIGKGFASFIVVAGGGTIIGIIWGYVTGFVTRFTNHAPILEPMFVFTMAYLSYLCAEIFHMSGILAITFCGITMKNYVEQNISKNSSITIRSSAHMLANMAEMMIFLFVGVFTITGTTEEGESIHEWNWWFVIMTIFACIIFRVIGVLILAYFANRFRIKKLSWTEQLIMMYGGLRGGVAFALVLLLDESFAPHAKMFVTTTLAMVYWTVFVQGITIKPVVLYFRVKKKSETVVSLTERITNRLMDGTKTAIEDIIGDNSEIPIRVRNLYKIIDEKFIKPILVRENKTVKESKLLETFFSIQDNDAKQYISQMSVKTVQKEMDSFSSSAVDIKSPRSNESYINEAFRDDSADSSIQ